jgi:hypothetical protein
MVLWQDFHIDPKLSRKLDDANVLKPLKSSGRSPLTSPHSQDRPALQQPAASVAADSKAKAQPKNDDGPVVSDERRQRAIIAAAAAEK